MRAGERDSSGKGEAMSWKIREDHDEHEAWVKHCGIVYGGGFAKHSYVGPRAARAAGLRRLRESYLTRQLTSAERRSIITRFMRAKSSGYSGVILARWLDALEDYGHGVRLGVER